MNGPDDRHLVFTGFMGAGKSTLAGLTAARLQRTAYDSDDLIVARAGRSIVDIFESGEEPFFRSLEADVIADLMESRPAAVIALGGGALDNPQTLNRVVAKGFLVNLAVEWAQIQAELPRLKSTRPLLRDRSDADVHALFERRQAIYRQAHLTIAVDRGDPDVTAERVLAGLAALSSVE